MQVTLDGDRMIIQGMTRAHIQTLLHLTQLGKTSYRVSELAGDGLIAAMDLITDKHASLKPDVNMSKSSLTLLKELKQEQKDVELLMGLLLIENAKGGRK